MIKKLLLIPFLLLMVLSQPLPVLGQSDSSDHEIWTHDILHEKDSFQAKFLNMLIILALLIGFMILASMMLKRMMKTRVSHLNHASLIKVVETRHLSPKATLYLVEVQDQMLLVAESPTSLNHLASFPTVEKSEKERI